MESDIELKGILGLKSRPFLLHRHKLHLLEELLYSLAEKKKKNQEGYVYLASRLEKEL